MSDVRFDPFETDINGLSSLHYAAMGFIEIQDLKGTKRESMLSSLLYAAMGFIELQDLKGTKWESMIKHRHTYTYITVVP